MASLTIRDLPAQRTLDARAMTGITGAGAGWVYGWIQPYIGAASHAGSPVINLFQTNNLYQAQQMNNQLQVIDVHNSGDHARFDIAPLQAATNAQFLPASLRSA
jgi:hypothetical protein